VRLIVQLAMRSSGLASSAWRGRRSGRSTRAEVTPPVLPLVILLEEDHPEEADETLMGLDVAGSDRGVVAASQPLRIPESVPGWPKLSLSRRLV
jgi:hypothetical protein